MRVEEMLKRSFSEDGNQKSAPEQAATLAAEQKLLEGLEKLNCPICEVDLETFYAKCRDVRDKSKRIYRELFTSTQQRLLAKTLYIGSIVIVDVNEKICSVPVVYLKRIDDSSILVAIPESLMKSSSELRYPPWHVVKPAVHEITKYNTIKTAIIPLSALVKITTSKLKIPVDCIVPNGNQINFKDVPGILAEFAAVLSEVVSDFEEAKFPQFSSSAGGFEFDELAILRRSELQFLRSGHFTCTACPDLFAHYTQIHRKKLLTDRLASIQFKLSDESLHLLPEYENRVRVLTELNFLDAGHTVQIKGRVACEINTVDPLLLTELLFQNAFGDLSPGECAAFLAGLVFQEKSSLGSTGLVDPEEGRETIEGLLQRLLLSEAESEIEEDKEVEVEVEVEVENESEFDKSSVRKHRNYLVNVTPGIENTVKRLISLVSRLSACQRENGLSHLPCGTGRSYLLSVFNPALIRTVYEWTRGTSFLHLTTEITTIPEGSIVRCITRLDETCREAAGAGKIMGDPILVQKMEEAAKLIRRDICFASSLYL